jgi:hypothetical protein
MAPHVMPGGRILAVDFQPEMLALLALKFGGRRPSASFGH